VSTPANGSLARESETIRLELQEANRRLREATEQFQAMFEQGMFAARLRLDGTVIDINRAAVEVCGLNRADILDRPFWECGWWNRSQDVQAFETRLSRPFPVSHSAASRGISGEMVRSTSSTSPVCRSGILPAAWSL
jgi:PAS domain-containing protein